MPHISVCICTYKRPIPLKRLLDSLKQQETGGLFTYSVVVAGSLPGKALPDGTPGPGLYCAVIVKRVDEKTRSKVSINELLRD